MDNKLIAELEQRTKDAIKRTEDAIAYVKVWFYNMTGISLLTSADINNSDKERIDGQSK